MSDRIVVLRLSLWTGSRSFNLSIDFNGVGLGKFILLECRITVRPLDGLVSFLHYCVVTWVAFTPAKRTIPLSFAVDKRSCLYFLLERGTQPMPLNPYTFSVRVQQGLPFPSWPAHANAPKIINLLGEIFSEQITVWFLSDGLLLFPCQHSCMLLIFIYF